MASKLATKVQRALDPIIGFDPVHRPEHYATLTPEPIDVIESWGLGFHLGQVIKYVARAGRKDPTKTVEDLEKSAWYLNRYISRLKRTGK